MDAQEIGDACVPLTALLQLHAVLLGAGAAFRVAGEAVVELGEPSLETRPALRVLCGAQLELTALRGEVVAAGIERARRGVVRLATGAGPAVGELERRQAPFQRVHRPGETAVLVDEGR